MPEALIAVNHIGFMHFILQDIDLLREMGFSVDVAADNAAGERHTEALIREHGASRLLDIRLDRGATLTRGNLRCYRAYRDLLRKKNYSLIIAHTPIIGFIVRMAARSASVRKRGGKVIYFSHGMMSNHLLHSFSTRMIGWAERFASSRCDAICCLNAEDRERFESMHAPLVCQVPGVGLDLSRFKDLQVDRVTLRETLGVRDNAVMVLSVGRLSPEKNQISVVRALGLLKDRQRFTFVICGGSSDGGAVRTALEQEAARLGVDLVLLGHRSDVPQVIACADIGVLTSLREGLPVGGLELLASGVPVIGTDVQGIREFCHDGETGVRIPHPNDIDAIAAAIERLSDSSLRESMRDSCRRMAERFSLARSLAVRRCIYAGVSAGDSPETILKRLESLNDERE